MIGTGVGVGLGAAYLAGGMARAATDHQRAARLAEAAAGGFSDAVLERDAADMDPGVLQVARRHDPFTVAGSAARDRQTAVLASRLEQHAELTARTANLRGVLKASYTPPYRSAAAPFQSAGPLESSRELECLTQAVYFEARGEGSAGQAAVAQVVLNRVRHPAFPKSVCGVVFQGAAHRVGCQFSFACDGSMRARREGAAWNQAQRIASRALSGVVMAGVGDATHFHTATVAPTWGPRLLRVAQVGMHVFYRFGRGAGASVYLADSRAGRTALGAPLEYARPTAGPTQTADGATIDFRLTSAVLVDKAADGAKVASQTAPEPGSAATETRPTADKPIVIKVPEPAKLTAASASRSPDAATRALAGTASSS